jgi:hypothetical protein
VFPARSREWRVRPLVAGTEVTCRRGDGLDGPAGEVTIQAALCHCRRLTSMWGRGYLPHRRMPYCLPRTDAPLSAENPTQLDFAAANAIALPGPAP